MNKAQNSEDKRKEILKEMSEIRVMRRGTVNEQFFDTKRADGSVIRNGPYYLYSRTEKRKSFGKRITEEQVEKYRGETENCRKFKELSNRYILACEQIADHGAEEKKRLKHRKKG
jgi:hypothetical protein